jgi:hypothetical protein
VVFFLLRFNCCFKLKRVIYLEINDFKY